MAENITFKGYIWQTVEKNVAKQPDYEVKLSTGDTLQGELSPRDEQSDYIRLNPKDGGASYAIPLRHIVYVRRAALTEKK